jgi:hypothetical protein
MLPGSVRNFPFAKMKPSRRTASRKSMAQQVLKKHRREEEISRIRIEI